VHVKLVIAVEIVGQRRQAAQLNVPGKTIR